MQGGALTLARMYLEKNCRPELILASDMFDLSTFLALTRKDTASIPAVLYFHENQLSYPLSPNEKNKALKKEKHYGFINFASAMAAERCFFNSAYHRKNFITEVEVLLRDSPGLSRTRCSAGTV